MRRAGIAWSAKVFSLAAAAEVLLIVAAVVYMVLYGLFHTGHPEDFYTAHARVASPWVSIAVGLPVFFLFARWLARRASPGSAMRNALAFWLTWAVIDTAILVGAEGFGGIGKILPFWLASLVTKLAAAWAAARVSPNYSDSWNVPTNEPRLPV